MGFFSSVYLVGLKGDVSELDDHGQEVSDDTIRRLLTKLRNKRIVFELNINLFRKITQDIKEEYIFG